VTELGFRAAVGATRDCAPDGRDAGVFSPAFPVENGPVGVKALVEAAMRTAIEAIEMCSVKFTTSKVKSAGKVMLATQQDAAASERYDATQHCSLSSAYVPLR
jgi:hypothetical protein